VQNGGDILGGTISVPEIKHNIYKYKVPNHRKIIKPVGNYVRKFIDHKSPSKPIISRNLVLNEKNFSFEERIQELSNNMQK
jgi:hypothetical protein